MKQEVYERFADFLNGLSFSDVIDFFNYTMEDMLQSENYAMYDYTRQEDAIEIIRDYGIEKYLQLVNHLTPEERAFMCAAKNGGSEREELFCINPWAEILEGYTDWILDHVQMQLEQWGNDAAIIIVYPQLKEVLFGKKLFNVECRKVFTKVAAVYASTPEEAIERVRKDYARYDPLEVPDNIVCDEVVID